MNTPNDHFLNCMNQIVRLYETVFQETSPRFCLSQKPGENVRQAEGDLDGYFLYHRGGSHFVPIDILMKLPSERPIRVRLDMSVMQSKGVNRVYPRYLQEAITKHTGGKVVVRLESDRDGRLPEAKAMEGNPMLSQAVMEALKQWRYEPTRLDGDPVEVEVDVEMGFESR